MMETIIALLVSAVIVQAYWLWRLNSRIVSCVAATALALGMIDKKFHDVGEILKEVTDLETLIKEN